MSFLNAKIWPNIPANVFQEQYEKLNLSDSTGLWFRAIGTTGNNETMVVEVWDTMLSWRAVHEAEQNNKKIDDSKQQHQAFKPGESLRQEMTSYFFPVKNEYPLSEWINVESNGQILIARYPQISAQKYLSGISKHGQQEDMVSAKGVHCAVDGPDDHDAWVIMRIESEVDEANAEKQKHLADLEKPEKTTLFWKANLKFIYYTRECPSGIENQFVEGYFL
ncbi:MAG: hypothetical protein AAF600_20615 [Bacteroidota bacterium]